MSAADWAQHLGRRFGGITTAPGASFTGPDHGTRVAESPHVAAYWDLAEGQRRQPDGHLPWVEVHKAGGKGVHVPAVPGQRLDLSLGVER